ncbi:MAG: T9SS type A sorting domain-containing protein [Rhodothermales bacterium]|nr:T9SS type A sorting domain-containing protein [Rhodothermales bacterium]
MRIVTVLSLAALFILGTSTVSAQDSEYNLNVPTSDDINVGYNTGIHSGARDIAGPLDGDGDGKYEVYVADYSGGGRVHVVENVSPDVWELVYSTPVLDSTATTNNIRTMNVGDMDNDGKGEIYFLSGRGFSATNPNIANYPPGMYVFENVGDNDWGTAPATVFEFNGDLPDRWRAERMDVEDVDGDGRDEVLLANNGSSNDDDTWYVIGASGDIGSGFEVFVEELKLASRSASYDTQERGGGSPYSAIAADFDGDGMWEISLHSWNFYNFTNARATGVDTYTTPEAENLTNINLQAAFPADHVAFFGCVAVDINGDNDDEVVCPNLDTGDGSIINYEAGEETLEIVADNIAVGVLEGLSTLGVGAGDLNGNGLMEIFGTGLSYTGGQFDNGSSPGWINRCEYTAGDVEDSASYVCDRLFFDADRLESKFRRIERDSAGVMTVYHEDGAQGPEFVSKFAYLGDADMDGKNELAFALQGVDDSTFVIDEVWDGSAYVRTVRTAEANPNRTFMKVISGAGDVVSIEDEWIVLPSDYKLYEAYPNPFNPSTTISFELPIDKNIRLNIYDMTGRLVRSLISDQTLASGRHEITWNGRSDSGLAVASGTYVYSLEYGNFRQSKTMVLVK